MATEDDVLMASGPGGKHMALYEVRFKHIIRLTITLPRHLHTTTINTTTKLLLLLLLGLLLLLLVLLLYTTSTR